MEGLWRSPARPSDRRGTLGLPQPRGGRGAFEDCSGPGAAGRRCASSLDRRRGLSRFSNGSQNAAGPNSHVPSGWHAAGAAGLSFSLDLDLFGKNRAALRAADKDAEAARFEADETQLLLATGIASAYANLAALYAQRDNLEAALNIRSQSLKFCPCSLR